MEKLEDLKLFIYEHKTVMIIGGAIFFLLLGIGSFCGYQYFQKEKKDRKESIFMELEIAQKEEKDTNEEILEATCQILVDIKGKVNQPGLYSLECGSRVQDAITAAGGITGDADTSVLNLGKKVFDEMVIVVYSKNQTANFIETKQQQTIKEKACQEEAPIKNDACMTEKDINNSENIESTSDLDANNNQNNQETKMENTLISINKATKEELIKIPGIGESKADKIISYRNEKGEFLSIEDIKNVSGIGDSIFEKIKPYITL